MERSVMWFCILTLQLGFTLKLTVLAVSFLSERSSASIFASSKRYVFEILKWWKEPLDARSQHQLDQTRCSWTRLVWRMVAAVAMFRLVIRQVRLGEDTEVGSQWDCSVVIQAAFALLFTSFPTLINPRCQDLWYVVTRTISHDLALLSILFLTIIGYLVFCRCCLPEYANIHKHRNIMAFHALSSLNSCFKHFVRVKTKVVMETLDVSFIIQAQIGGIALDVRDVITFFFPGRFIYAILAKRTCCVMFCVTLHLLQAIYMAKSQGDVAGTAYSSQAVVAVFLVMLGSIICVRRLLRENASLKVDLHERTVELGAVSALLTACYDAVLEVDDELNLTQDSRQLSSMLLSARPGGLCGEALLGFFCERDQARISELLNGEGRSVVALNADMLDSDHNQVKVELFSVQFKNLANARCFLVAVREIQHAELCASQAELGSAPPIAQAPSQPFAISNENEEMSPHLKIASENSETDLLVVFDLYDFEVYNMNGKMQRLCEQCLSVAIPDDILDIASHDTRPSLNNQLQTLANSFTAHVDTTVAQVEDLGSSQDENRSHSVSFNLLELWEAKGTLTIEYDQVLNTCVGSMVIERVSKILTLKNLQDLDRNGVPNGDGRDGSCHSHSVSLGVAAAALGSPRSRRRGRSALSRSSRSSRGTRSRWKWRTHPGEGNEGSGCISQLHPKIRL